MKTLLVTGGAGFIGSNFIRTMLGKYPEYRIVNLDKLTYAGNLSNLRDVEEDPRYTFVKGDICDAMLVDRVTKEHEINVIVNFAAETHVDRSLMEPGSFIQTDVYGTYVLLEAAKKYSVERFHQVSSDETYGQVLEGSSVETDRLEPRSPYSASKAGGDHMVYAYYVSFGVLATITRGSNSILEEEKVIAFDGDRFICKKIEDVYAEYGQQSGRLTVPAFDPETCQIGLYGVSDLIREYVHKDAYRIKTKYGKTVSVTGDHSLFKMDDQGRPVAVLARELQVGDYIATAGALPVVETADEELHIGHHLAESSELADNIMVVGDQTEMVITTRSEEIRDFIYNDEQYQQRRGPRSAIYFWTARQWSNYQAMPLKVYNHLGADIPSDAQLRASFSNVAIPVSIELDEEMLWLCGFILAEGQLRCGKEPGNYLLGLYSEERFIRRAKDILQRRFGVEPKYRSPTNHSVPTITVHSKPLVYLFAEALELGGMSRERRVPRWVFNLALNKLQHFIQGFYDGDGCHNGKVRVERRLFSFATASHLLAEDMIQLLLRFGVVASLQGPYQNTARRGGKKKYTSYRVAAYGIDPLNPVDWSEKPRQTLQTYKTAEIVWTRIQSIERIEYEGYVYDFSVPDVENFLTGSGILAHNSIGPYQYPEKVVPLFITNAIDDLPLPIYGDGLQMRDYQYVLDHCEGIDLVLHKGKPGEIYNLGTGVETRNIDMARLILRRLGKPETLIRHVKDRPGHDRRYSINCDKIKRLGWRSRHTFEEALEKTIQWYVDNEWWWRKIKDGSYRAYYERQYGRGIA